MQLTTQVLESFALGEDREKALEQLIPGTEEHAFLSCLHLQHQGRLDEVEALLAAWKDRHGRTDTWEKMTDRQALLRWGKDGKVTIERLQSRIGPSLHHAREVEDEKPRHPTRLDPARLDRTRLLRQALEHTNHLSPFTPAANAWLVRQKLDGDRRRELLERLDRPDHEGLVELIVEDLKHRHSRGFGSLRAHRLLTLEQLEQLVRKEPGLATDPRWVQERLIRLQPGPDEDGENDPAVRQGWLERLEAAVAPLPPAFNSLKAQVLYHRLDHDRRRGVFDRERLVAYLKLPRQSSLAAPEWNKKKEHERHLANLGEDHRAATLLPPPGDDAPLIREHLEQHLAKEDGWSPWETWVREDWLRTVWAEAQLLLGKGDLERSSALLGHGHLQELRERVELRLLPTNPRLVPGDQAVRLEVELKHTPTLVVKVYELNPLGWFLSRGSEIQADIDLDGLVPTNEQTLAIDAPPYRRVRRSLELPGLDRPGLFAVELIGNGRSSRALLRKGWLRALERRTAAGHAFTIVDEAGKPCPAASLWVEGQEHRADEGGEVRLPFTTTPGHRTALLVAGERASVVHFQRLAEEYRFSAAIHVERESLVKRSEARVLVRAGLSVHGVPLPLELVEKPRLVIESTDRHDVSSTREVSGFELKDGREAVHAFQVPEDLARLVLTVKGEVKKVSSGETIQLAHAAVFELNAIDKTEQHEALHLRRAAEGFALLLLGKNGEERADVPLQLELHHRDLTSTLHETLQTDAHGRVELGALPSITQLRVSAPSGVSGSWWLQGGDAATLPALLQARAGETLALPWAGRDWQPELVSFLGQRRGEGWTRDLARHLALEGGLLLLKDLPAGDHELRLHATGASVAVRVGTGPRAAGWVTGPRRLLEAPREAPLQLLPLEAGANEVRLRLVNATPETRVHLFATRFVPARAPGAGLWLEPPQPPRGEGVRSATSEYLSGRALGDEVRYVLERRYAKRRPGNFLPRPQLLLNPWAVRSTDTAGEHLRAGEAYAQQALRAGYASTVAPCAAPPCPEPDPGADDGAFANLDFLGAPAPVLVDLRPDGAGQIVVQRAALGDAVLVRAVAVDGRRSVAREAFLPDKPFARAELRLRRPLDPEQPSALRREATPLASGQKLVVEDLAGAKLEVLDSLGGAFRLLGTLLGDARLDRFSWLTRWPQLDPAEKRARYSEFAGHELHLFLKRKDPEFFRAVVAPYLANRRHKTFVDLWLLGADLKPFLDPWRLGRLNAVERALLALALPGEQAAVVRRLEEELATSPPDPEEEERRFRTALQGRALEADDALGLRAVTLAAKDKADEAYEMEEEKSVRRLVAKEEAPAKKAKRSAPKAGKGPGAAERAADCAEESLAEMDDFEGGGGGRALRDLDARREQAPRWRQQDKTQELAERSWWEVPRGSEGPHLVPPGRFWRDLARHREGPFLSPHLTGAARNLHEVLCALAFLDLPFVAEPPRTKIEGPKLELEARTPCLVFTEQVGPAPRAAEPLPILVNQSYLEHHERWIHEEDGTQRERYLARELLVHRAYVCQVALTNPTSTPRKLELLLQIPRGAVPILNGFWTRGHHVHLGGFATETVEYGFYFPAAGEVPHAPVQVSHKGEVVAAAAPATLSVLLKPSTVDTTSWAWVSQHAPPEQLHAFLDQANLARLDLTRIAWRMREKEQFRRVTELLQRRHCYADALWAYALQHQDAARLAEWVRHQDWFLQGLGPWLHSPLLVVDPVERGSWEHLEYAPLINARAHALAGQARIRNRSLEAQWSRWLGLLCHLARPADEERLLTAIYLLLQDRVDEGLALLAKVSPEKVTEKLQLDYLRAHAAFFGERPELARAIADGWREHPVDRWRDLFHTVLRHLDEAAGREAELDPEAKDRDRRQEGLAAHEPAFELVVEGRSVRIEHQNLAEVEVRWYLMDVELLFSRQPFVQEQGGGAFASVRPNRTATVRFAGHTGVHALALPAELAGKNALVEVCGGGKVQAKAVYAHALAVQVVERWGQLSVRHHETRAPLPATYVKAYARLQGGEVKFMKDGYTDLRGRFDFASLSTDDVDRVERFALLVLHDQHGAVIREAAPPAR